MGKVTKSNVGKKKITINDVAKELQVSTSTISRAISGKGRIGDATREKVLQYIAENNYHPNGIAKSLAQSKTNNIGIIIPEIYEVMNQAFFQNCMYGIEEVALANEYDLLMVTAGGGDMKHLERLVNNNKVDGMILTRALHNDIFAEYLKVKKVPFLLIGSVDDSEIVQVDNQHEEACKELVSILISKKVDKIAYVGGYQEYLVNQNRYQGYADALEEAGKGINKDFVFRNLNTDVCLEAAVDALLEIGIDCILCQDDTVCLFVMQYLRERNINIPGQVKLASCYYNKQLAGSAVAVTSLNFDILEIGRTAGKILIDYIEGKPVPQKTMLGYEIILKESTK